MALGSGARAPASAASSAPAARREVANLDEAMIKHIEQALSASGGRIKAPNGAAALLEINPHTLRARMRKLGVDWARFRSPAAAEAPPKMDT